jgi:hypothetical protein
MLCSVTGGVASACRSSDAPHGGTEGLLTAFRPVSRDSQPPALGAASVKEGAAASSVGCSATDGDPASAGRLASGTGLVIFWITNLWRGERRDDTTLNRAPLIEHLNSTSLSSTLSGWNHSVTAWAGDLPTLAVWDPQFLTANSTNYDCQILLLRRVWHRHSLLR